MQPMLERSALALPHEPEFETRAPLRMRTRLRHRGRLGLHGSERDVIFVKRHTDERAIDVLERSVG